MGILVTSERSKKKHPLNDVTGILVTSERSKKSVHYDVMGILVTSECSKKETRQGWGRLLQC